MVRKDKENLDSDLQHLRKSSLFSYTQDTVLEQDAKFLVLTPCPVVRLLDVYYKM